MKRGSWEDHPESGMLARPRMEVEKEEEDVLRPGETKHCPYCAKTIRIEAVKCTHCGSMITKC